MDELEGRVATALLARDAAAPAPRPDLGAAVLVAASRRRRRRRVSSAAAVGALAAVVVAVPLVTGGGSDREPAPPAGGGSSGRGAPLDGGDLGGGTPRDAYTATLECYSYQHATGFLRPLDHVGDPAAAGPRTAIQAWWRRADIPPEWNTDVVVERSADAATEVILRADQTVGAVVELARSADGWRITGVNSCV